MLGVLDDQVGRTCLPGIPWLGKIEGASNLLQNGPGALWVVAIGDNLARRMIARRLEGFARRLATIVAPSAVVSRYSELGPGSVVMPQAVVNAGAKIGRHVILNTACSVDHDCQVGDFVHLSPGVHLAGWVEVGEGAHLGTGASARPRARVGDWAVVGAAACVIKDIPPHALAVGIPATIRGWTNGLSD